MYKKIIALSLGITLAVSSFPLAVFAEDVQGDGSVASVADSQDDEQPVGEDAVDVDVAECDFADPDSFAESGICGDNATWSYDDTEGCLTISGSGDIYDYQNPDEDGSFIAPWFDLCDCILSIVIDDGITYIGDYAFSYLSDVTKVSVASSVKNIGDYSFAYCEDLYDLIFLSGSRLESIGRGAFGFCSSLDAFPFDKTAVLSSIGDAAFYKTSVESVMLVKSLTYLGTGAFAECTSLKRVSFEDDTELAVIGESAFQETSIRTIIIPSSVVSLGDKAFYACDNLSRVFFEDNCKITTLGESTFEGCAELRAVDLKGCTELTVIEDKAFCECIDLEAVVFPDSLTSIGKLVFRECGSLKKIVIPASVTSIGRQGFYIDDYKEIYCYAEANNISWNIDSEYEDFVIHVLSDQVDAYLDRVDPSLEITIIGDLVDIDSGIVLAGHSLSLDGFVGVNFYMELDSQIADSDEAYMLFTLPGTDNTQKVSVSDAKIDITAIPGKTLYIFSCKTAAKQMTDQIKAQVYLADNVPAGNEYTYSVVEYANYIVDHRDSYDEKVFAVVAGMLAYGGFSQLYFKYNTGHLAYDSMVSFDGYLDGILDVDANKISRIVSAADTEVDGNIVFKSVNLELESEMTMNFYFENVPDGTVFKLNGKELPSVKNASGLIVVTISGIPAHLIGSDYTVTLWSGDTELGSVTYSPMNYCYNVLSRETTETRTADLKNLIKAIYLYYKTADYYNS